MTANEIAQAVVIGVLITVAFAVGMAVKPERQCQREHDVIWMVVEPCPGDPGFMMWWKGGKEGGI